MQQSGPEGYAAFFPAPLPPDPSVEYAPELQRLLDAAGHALGRLDGLSAVIHPDRLLYMYVRKEAVLSSQIAGTQSTLSDLLRYESAESSSAPLDDVREVARYVAALRYGIEEIRSGRLPMSLRLIQEMHGTLMGDGRGEAHAPGEFRRTQNWIGGARPGNARYVPPPTHEMLAALDDFERFLHDRYGPIPPIVKAGLAHAQFETIHPFLDGNGRIGRLLISLLLVVDGVLAQPVLYLSLYFREHRAEYYDALQRVRTHGDWESWLRFYVTGVEAVARQAGQAALDLFALFDEDRQRVQSLGRVAGTTLMVYDLLRERGIVSIPYASRELDITWPTAKNALQRLETLGIAKEISGRRRDRVYAYEKQLSILDRGTEDRP